MIPELLAAEQATHTWLSPRANGYIDQIKKGNIRTVLSDYFELVRNFMIGQPVDFDDAIARMKDYRDAFAILLQASSDALEAVTRTPSEIYFWPHPSGNGLVYRRLFTGDLPTENFAIVSLDGGVSTPFFTQ